MMSWWKRARLKNALLEGVWADSGQFMEILGMLARFLREARNLRENESGLCENRKELEDHVGVVNAILLN